MRLKQFNYLFLSFTILLTSCAQIQTDSNISTGTVSSIISTGTVSERVIVGDCYKSKENNLPVQELGGPKPTVGGAIVASVLVPIATNYILDTVSSYIKKRETEKSATSTAIAYRQNINYGQENEQCVIFVRGEMGKLINEDYDTIVIPKESSWSVKDIKAVRDRGIPLLSDPQVYVELLLDSYEYKAHDTLSKKTQEGEKIYDDAGSSLIAARDDTSLTQDQLKTSEEKKGEAYMKWQEAKNEEAAKNYMLICPRPTYVDYLVGGAKTNRSGKKKLSVTSSFFTLEDGKKVEFYSHAFDLGTRKPGKNALTHESMQLFQYQRQKLKKLPSTVLPCILTKSGVDDLFVSSIFLETESKSDFNLAIADAIGSDATKKAVLDIVQENLKSDSDKIFDEANDLNKEKSLRKDLECSVGELLDDCVKRIRGGL